MSGEGALHGVRVLEVGGGIAADYCGKMLADLGADLVKIEPVGRGDPVRRAGPFQDDLPDNEAGGLHLFLNRNKRSVTLDIERVAGRRLLREMVGHFDLLIDSTASSQEASADLDALHAEQPKLIIATITPFGRNGPWQLHSGGRLIGSHASGVAYMNPAEGVSDLACEPPLQAPGEFADYTIGVTAALGCMSALLSAERVPDEEQPIVDISEQEALASTVRTEMAAFTFEKEQPGRLKMRKRSGGMLYPCRDGYFVMSATGDGFWPALVEMMGTPDWVRSEWCATSVLRHTHIEQVNAAISAWAMAYDASELEAMAIAARLPFGVVQTVAALAADVQLAERDFFSSIEFPNGEAPMPGAPYKLSATPWSSGRRAPRLGEHNAEIYCDLLGYDRAALVRMRQSDLI